jgi:hypothetical protein
MASHAVERTCMSCILCQHAGLTCTAGQGSASSRSVELTLRMREGEYCRRSWTQGCMLMWHTKLRQGGRSPAGTSGSTSGSSHHIGRCSTCGWQ